MALADRVEQMKKSDAGLAAILVTILKSVELLFDKPDR